METIGKDLWYAVRGFCKTPAFTSVALLSLALGIGATTAIFSVVYGVLIAPYPYAKPGEIWAPAVRSLKAGQGGHGYTVAEFLELQKAPMFSDVMATRQGPVLMTGDRNPESFNGVFLSGNAFNFLGVLPVIGRTIQPSDVRQNGDPEPVVELSYQLWQRLFDGSSDALGKTLVLNGMPHTIIGVMPPRFGWYGQGFWLPLGVGPQDQRGVNPIMRLRGGVTSDAAREQLHALHLAWAAERPGVFPQDGFQTLLRNYLDITVASGEMKSSLQLLFAAVGFLLLIACANVANLLLARNAARTKEIVVRLAIGAGRRRLLRQLLTESLLLSVAGGALGVAFAVAITNSIVALMPSFYVPNEARVTLNIYVLLFSLAVSMLTGVLFGLTPALQSSRPNLAKTLNEGTPGSGGSFAGRRTRSVLVVTESALAVVLLASASLSIRSFLKLNQVELGFQPDHVLGTALLLPPAKYSTWEQRNRFAQEVLDRVRQLPGVVAVTIGVGAIPYSGPQSVFAIPGRTETEPRSIGMGLIGADYPRVMGIPLKRGRLLTDAEVARADHFALINEAAVALWPNGEDPVGRTIRLDLVTNPGSAALTPPAPTAEMTVVGIIGNTMNAGMRSPTAPGVFIPYTLLAPTGRTIAVRTQGPPMLLLNAVRQQVLAIDKEQPLGRSNTLEEVLGNETVQPRFNMALFSAFGVLAVALATAGIYSVVSYHVARRTREIGIRVSLGARTGDVSRLVLSIGMKLVLIGLGVGLTISAILARLVKTQVFDVADFTVGSMAIVALVLGLTALIACYAPARRATKLDPLSALRHD